jgi:hypothetical protein
VAYLALFVALGGGALAATGLVGSDGKIRGCVSSTGQLKVLKPGKHCRRGQTAITWSQRGRAGEDGAPGLKGEPGPTGEPGPEATNAAHAASADSAANADTLDSKDSSAFARAGSEGWYTAKLKDAGPGGFECSWQPYGGGFSSPGFFRDSAGIVHLRGLVKAVDSAFPCSNIRSVDRTIFAIGSGYRPETDVALTTVSNNKAGRINMRAGGGVEIEPNFPAFSDATHWVSLDGLTFRCGPSGQNGCP